MPSYLASSAARIGLALLLLAGSACTAPLTMESAPEFSGTSEFQVVVDPSLLEVGAAPRTAWQFYGLLKAKVFEQRDDLRDDYWVEAASRGALAKYWEKDARPKPGEGNAYLDTLVEIQRAGLIEEYVLVTLARPGWTIPRDMFDGLDLQGFAAWSREKLAEHKVETLAGVRRGTSDLSPTIPGDSLPSVDDLSRGDTPCASLPRASAAYAAWRQLEARLPGVALASRDRGSFVAGVARLQASGARGRAVTWVSPKAADLSYLVGFCETDRNQMAASVDPLETAVRLDPLTPLWRLELATALTAVKRFDDARREIQTAIATTADDCVLGSAWRKQGFLEIETGDLEHADLSYRKSLEYEPGNPMALSELSIILKMRVKQGDAKATPYTPPPTLAPVKKTCSGG